MSGGGNSLSKFMPISFIKRVSRFLRCFSKPATPIAKLLVYTGMLPYLVPCWPQIVQFCMTLSRSDLVLDADHSLGLLGTQEA